MLENRRYARYDISNEHISVQLYDMNGFTHIGYIIDISAGGLKFKSNVPIKWNKNKPLTIYFEVPNRNRLISIDVNPIRSNNKFFQSQHAGEFIGTFALLELFNPTLFENAEAEVVTV